MPYLIAAVVLVGIIAVLDLIVTLGVVRRLRTHTELFDQILTDHAVAPRMMPIGNRPQPFTAITDTGATVSEETLSKRTLVAFFIEDCEGCHEMLPQFVAAAAGFPGGPGQVLAVVVCASTEDKVADYRARLAPVARVVVERPDRGVGKAMGVRAFPAFGLFDDGRLVAAGPKILDDYAAVSPGR